MPRDHDSPVDLPGGRAIGGRPLLWTSTVIGVATAVLALTNAIAIDGWVAELAPSEAVAQAGAASGRWHAYTDRVGLGAPRAAMHRTWQGWQAARLPGQPQPDAPDQR